MVSLNSGPISMIDSLSSIRFFNPNYSVKLSLGFLEVKPRKNKGCCFRVLRMCNNDNKRTLGWDDDGSKDLELEVLEFMKGSEKPGMFPSKKNLIRCGRFDLVERIVKQGGWLSMGWDSDEEVRVNDTPEIDDLSSNPIEEVDGENDSGIEGILTRLEKERNLSLGISLKEKGESNGVMNGSVPWSSVVVTASELEEVKPLVSVSDSSTTETWRTWSMKRAGYTDENFEAAEIFSTGLDDVKKNNITDKDSGDNINGKDNKTPSSTEEISTVHIKSRLQNLQSELSTVLQSLRSHPDEVETSKDSEVSSRNLENLNDDWEYKENEIIYAQNKLRSTRAKLAVLEGKMAMAIIEAQRIVREKQRRIDHATRALRLIRTTSIIWPNSASEVLLTGSFDGWSTQRKMKKAQNGVFSLSLKLYPGKYEIKFIVDGQWRVDPLRPIVTCDGYENNLLIIS